MQLGRKDLEGARRNTKLKNWVLIPILLRHKQSPHTDRAHELVLLILQLLLLILLLLLLLLLLLQSLLSSSCCFTYSIDQF
jgi:hypothetical protein